MHSIDSCVFTLASSNLLAACLSYILLFLCPSLFLNHVIMQFMNFACPEFHLFTDSIIKFFIILLSKMNEVADPSMYFLRSLKNYVPTSKPYSICTYSLLFPEILFHCMVATCCAVYDLLYFFSSHAAFLTVECSWLCPEQHFMRPNESLTSYLIATSPTYRHQFYPYIFSGFCM